MPFFRRAGPRHVLIAGKVLMDRNAPDGLRDDDLGGAERACLDLIARWHGVDRLAYAVTVRFAPTSTPAQLALAGRLCAADRASICRPTLPRTATRCVGCGSSFRRLEAISTSMRAPAAAPPEHLCPRHLGSTTLTARP
jgi:hypothetical protein